jgi:hypothetical protein
MIKSSMSSLLTFHEHPKKVGQMEIMQQNYKYDARCGVFLHWNLWTKSRGHTGWKKTAGFTRAVGFNIKRLPIFKYGYLIFWA